MSANTSRRGFLACLSAGATLSACGTDPGTGINPNAMPFDAGAASDFAVDSLRVNYQQNVVIGRDARGFYAMSATCTHAACKVSAPAGSVCIPAGNTDLTIPVTAPAGVAVMCCACHNSQFDRDGNVRGGPAPRPLTHYRVTITGGRVMVDPRTAAAISDRATPTAGDGGLSDASALD